MADQRAAEAAGPALTGFEHCPDEVLHIIRDNLLRGLDRLAAVGAQGQLDVRPRPGAATPREAGYTFAMLLGGIEATLRSRELARPKT